MNVSPFNAAPFNGTVQAIAIPGIGAGILYTFNGNPWNGVAFNGTGQAAPAAAVPPVWGSADPFTFNGAAWNGRPLNGIGQAARPTVPAGQMGVGAWLECFGPRAEAPLPPDLLSAVVAIFEGTAVRAEMQLWAKAVDDQADMPFAVVEERSSREERRYSGRVAYSIVLGFKIYAENMDQAGDLGDKLRTALIGQKPDFEGPVGVSPLIAPCDPRHNREMYRARNGVEAFVQDRELRVRVVRED